MEGSYSNVWQAKTNPPMNEYHYFLDQLIITIRNEIASCADRAYIQLPLQDAATLLFFTDTAQLLSFAQTRKNWIINPNTQTITLNQSPVPEGESSESFSKDTIITSALGIAKELEVIV